MEQVRAATPAVALGACSPGIPGAATTALIGQVAERWETALAAWRTRVTTDAAQLDAAAATYERSDAGSTQTFGEMARDAAAASRERTGAGSAPTFDHIAGAL